MIVHRIYSYVINKLKQIINSKESNTQACVLFTIDKSCVSAGPTLS